MEDAIDALTKVLNEAAMWPSSKEQGGACTIGEQQERTLVTPPKDMTPLEDKEDSRDGVKASRRSAFDGPMVRAAKEGLARFGVQYSEHLPREESDGRHLLSFPTNCICVKHDAAIVIWEKDSKFSFYLKAPTLVPKHLRTQVALYLNRVNHGLAVGNFEMDLSDGMVCFRSSCLMLGSKLSSDTVTETVRMAMCTMNQFFPGLAYVLDSGEDPEEAYKYCLDAEDAKDTEEKEEEDDDALV